MHKINFNRSVGLILYSDHEPIASEFALNKWQTKQLKFLIQKNNLLSIIEGEGELQGIAQELNGLPLLTTFFTVDRFKQLFIKPCSWKNPILNFFCLQLEWKIKKWEVISKTFEILINFHEIVPLDIELFCELCGKEERFYQENPFSPEGIHPISFKTEKFFEERVNNLFITGPTGSGKSRLGVMYSLEYTNVVYIDGLKLMALLKKRRMTESFIHIFKASIRQADVIIIDEIDRLSPLETVINILSKYVFIRDKKVIATSIYQIKELEVHLPKKITKKLSRFQCLNLWDN